MGFEKKEKLPRFEEKATGTVLTAWAKRSISSIGLLYHMI